MLRKSSRFPGGKETFCFGRGKRLNHGNNITNLFIIVKRLRREGRFSSWLIRSMAPHWAIILCIFLLIYIECIAYNAGDDVLRELTAIVSKPIRKHDLFARWGGEEFLNMVTNSAKSGAALFAEKLRRKIEAFDFPQVESITCSFGVAEFEKDDTIDPLVKKADVALYRAKSAGRNRVELS